MKLNKTDLQDWLEETKDVTKLKKDSKLKSIESSSSIDYSKIEKQQLESEAIYQATLIKDKKETKILDKKFHTKKALTAQDTISSKINTLDFKTLSKLKQGKFRYQAHIDLHGYIIDEAKKELSLFLNYAYLNNLKCVLVTHGKGGKNNSGIGKIKEQIPFWLEQFDFILAFSSALPKHGGSGALYILLKSK